MSSRNDYEFITRLGKGAQGSVYKAIKKSTGETIALKVINTEPGSTLYKNAVNEIKVLEEIAAPNCQSNLACYLGHGYDPNHNELYIEMEFIEGETLHDYAAKFRNDNDYDTLHKHLLLIVKDLIKGLMYVHEKGILHNDIKPENIMISKDLVPKLVDFGLACNTYTCSAGGKDSICCGGFSGTPDFASPEMYNHEIRSNESDIWSMGATLYNTATGTYPFNYGTNGTQPTNRDIMQAIRDNEPLKLNTPNQLLNDIVNRSLVKDVANRISGPEINEILTVL